MLVVPFLAQALFMLFTSQQIAQSEALFYVVLVVLVVFPCLKRALFYVVLVVLVVFPCLKRSVIIRCTCCSCCFPSSSGSIETTQTTLTLFFSDEPFSHFSCDRFLIVCPWFFFSTCDFVKKVPSNRGEALILMYHFRSQFCGLKTGKWGLRDLFYPIFFGFYRLSYRLCCRI